MIGQSREMFTCGSARRDLSPLECFTSMFPIKHLEVIKHLTNVKLEEHSIRLVTFKEILKFFGVLILLTRFTVPSRRDLWKTKSLKYVPTPALGNTMSRKRFEETHQLSAFMTSRKISMLSYTFSPASRESISKFI